MDSDSAVATGQVCLIGVRAIAARLLTSQEAKCH